MRRAMRETKAIPWEEVFARVAADDVGKVDLAGIPLARVRMQKGGSVLVDYAAAGAFGLSDHAATQWASRVVPFGGGTYVNRGCPPDLRAENFNTQTRFNHNGRDVLLRTKDGAIRAMLSDAYSVYDNRQFLEAIDDAVDDSSGEYTIRRFDLTDDGMYMRVSVEEDEEDYGNPPDIQDPDGGLQCGLMFANSEVGKRAITIKALVWRLVCSNGLISVRTEDVFRKAHAHTDKWDMVQEVSGAIRAMRHSAVELRARFRETRNERFSEETNMGELIRRIRSDRRVISSDDLAMNWILHMMASRASADTTVFDVVNGLTAAAREVDNPETQMELEQEASRIVTWKDDDYYADLFRGVLAPAPYAMALPHAVPV